MVDDLGPDLKRLLGLFDIDAWDRATNEYFDRTEHPNAVFNHLGRSWLQQVVAPTLADNLFQRTVGLVEKWEEDHSPDRRHKGTPYYFLGMGHTWHLSDATFVSSHCPGRHG